MTEPTPHTMKQSNEDGVFPIPNDYLFISQPKQSNGLVICLVVMLIFLLSLGHHKKVKFLMLG
jgi:hypothetical protein